MNALVSTQRLTDSTWELADMFKPFPEKTFKKGEEILNKHRSPKGMLFILVGKVLSFSTDEITEKDLVNNYFMDNSFCLLYTSPSPRDLSTSRMPSSA